jgi:hypothetical protein
MCGRRDHVEIAGEFPSILSLVTSIGGYRDSIERGEKEGMCVDVGKRGNQSDK